MCHHSSLSSNLCAPLPQSFNVARGKEAEDRTNTNQHLQKALLPGRPQRYTMAQDPKTGTSNHIMSKANGSPGDFARLLGCRQC